MRSGPVGKKAYRVTTPHGSFVVRAHNEIGARAEARVAVKEAGHGSVKSSEMKARRAPDLDGGAP